MSRPSALAALQAEAFRQPRWRHRPRTRAYRRFLAAVRYEQLLREGLASPVEAWTPELRQAMCREAWMLIREAQAGVRYTGPEPRPSPDEEEQVVYDACQNN